MLALILGRFVSPGAVYWVREFVASGKLNRQLLRPDLNEDADSRERFRAAVERNLRYQVVAQTPDAMMSRCLRIRELLSLLSARRDESTDSRPADLGGAIMELADMLHHLSSRMKPGLDKATPIIGAAEILSGIIGRVDPVGTPLSDPEDDAIVRSDTWFNGAAEPLSSAATAEGVERWLMSRDLTAQQVGEILIAAIYGLAFREQRLRARSRA